MNGSRDLTLKNTTVLFTGAVEFKQTVQVKMPQKHVNIPPQWAGANFGSWGISGHRSDGGTSWGTATEA